MSEDKPDRIFGLTLATWQGFIALLILSFGQVMAILSNNQNAAITQAKVEQQMVVAEQARAEAVVAANKTAEVAEEKIEGLKTNLAEQHAETVDALRAVTEMMK